ncbi:hypothetical protein [Halomontanus rarus]|uniref:hypothetical protein n=1 Tax=Halomontanus rarus TaxID=3034020 RepID=UPI0023E7DA28|nr:hypothetical protein [Halovivax sp. TS33]
MTSFPVEVLIGISVGLLLGIAPAFLVGVVAYALEYRWRRPLPGPLAGGVAVVIAAGGGYYGGVVELTAERGSRLVAAGLVACLLALYANSQGARIGSTLSRELYRPTRRERTLSADAIESIDGIGHMTIRTSGEIRAIAGYPPLAPDLRTALESGSWRLPADLPLIELETRLADRLRTTYELAAVSVSIDERGRASIAAAPPANGIAKRIPPGWRAISISALCPTGLAPGDEVIVEAGSSTTNGTVLSTDGRADEPTGEGGGRDETTGERHTQTRESGQPDEGTIERAPAATDGGTERVTVAVPTTDAGELLDRQRGRIVATSHRTNHEFEALSRLAESGQSVRHVTVTDERRATLARAGDGDGSTDGNETDATLLAVKRREDDARSHDWEFDPDGDAIDVATEAFVVGKRTELNERFGEPAEVSR